MADSDSSETPTSLQVPARKGTPGGPAILPERYEPLDTLGRGGMGEVLAVRDSVLGREVAVKRMLETAPTAEDRARFLREARIQGALDHPAIPPVHELAYDAEGRPYMVMKRLVGTTLSEVFAKLRGNDPAAKEMFPRQRLIGAFVDVCLAVELAHTRGVVHRDLKPANIMLGEFGEVFVLDWGVAKVRGDADSALRSSGSDAGNDDATQVGVVIGTPGFMSPEQRKGGELDGRSDVFALGCLLHEIVTGVRPAVDAPLPLRPETDAPELADLIRAATEPEVNRRPTARSLGESLRRFVEGDRDLALRRTLAEQLLVRATAAADTKGDASLAEALGLAGRALALDPQNASAAALLARLMIEPPAKTPRELERELEAVRVSSARRLAYQGLFGYLAYGLFLPFIFWAGVVKWEVVGSYIATIVALAVLAWIGARSARPHWWRFGLSVIGNAFLLSVIGRMTTPFFVAPGLAAVTLMLFVSTPNFRNPRFLAFTLVTLTAGILVPWFLELAGVLDQTMFFAKDGLLLTIGATFNRGAVQVAFVAYTVGLMLAMGLLTRNLGRGDDDAQHRLRLYAWKLRQLLPSSG